MPKVEHDVWNGIASIDIDDLDVDGQGDAWLAIGNVFTDVLPSYV